MTDSPRLEIGLVLRISQGLCMVSIVKTLLRTAITHSMPPLTPMFHDDTDSLRRPATSPRVFEDFASTRGWLSPMSTADTAGVEFAVVVLCTLATCPEELFRAVLDRGPMRVTVMVDVGGIVRWKILRGYMRGEGRDSERSVCGGSQRG